MTSHILPNNIQKSKSPTYYNYLLISKAIDIVSRVKHLSDNERILRMCDEFDNIFAQLMNDKGE